MIRPALTLAAEVALASAIALFCYAALTRAPASAFPHTHDGVRWHAHAGVR